MYLNVFSVFIILSHQCLLICANSNVMDIPEKQVHNPTPNIYQALRNCSLRLPNPDNFRIPVPYTPDVKPNFGYLRVEPNVTVKLMCKEDRYVSIAYGKDRFIEVKCIEKHFVEFDGRIYQYAKIKCNPLPEPDEEPDLDAWKKYPEDRLQTSKNSNDCFFPVPKSDYRLPIPYTVNRIPSIMVPDYFGYLFIKHNTSFKVTCTTTKFQMASIRDESEITLTCIRNNFILFDTRVYKYSDFRCINIPKARLLVSNFKCQKNRHKIAGVGFQANKQFLLMYNICFNIITRSNVYSWYRIKTPYIRGNQETPELINFVRTKQLLGTTDVNSLYKQQVPILSHVLRSREQARKFIHLDDKHYLERGQLLSKNDFYYSFQQAATCFYENTTPLWEIFRTEAWKSVSRYLREKFANEPMTNRLIVSGTYGLCALPDIRSIKRPLYFTRRPFGIVVPKFIWKMDYNIDSRHGIVFIGLNDPYEKVNNSTYICKTIPCPERFREELENSRDNFTAIIYCCTSHSFQKTYGKLDPLVWRKNLA